MLSVCLLVIGVVFASDVFAASKALTNRQFYMSNNKPGAQTTYKFRYQTPDTGVISKVVFLFCENSALLDDSCDAPSGLDVSAANLQTQSGDTGYSVAPETDGHTLVLERSAAASVSGQHEYVFTDVRNPDASGTYYIRMMAYSGADTSVEPAYAGAVAYPIVPNVDVNATVPPFLIFCMGVTISGIDCSSAQGSYIGFGEFSAQRTAFGSTQMVVSTNALGGYSVRTLGTTLVSGNNQIPALASLAPAKTGVGQFGLNLRANNAPLSGADVQGPGAGQPTPDYSVANQYKFNSGDVVARSNSVDDSRKYTTTYIANIAGSQAPGVYVATISYLALGNF